MSEPSTTGSATSDLPTERSALGVTVVVAEAVLLVESESGSGEFTAAVLRIDPSEPGWGVTSMTTDCAIPKTANPWWSQRTQ